MKSLLIFFLIGFGGLSSAWAQPRTPILVIGAGVAGLSAALELQALGHEVMVLEAGARPGGKAQSVLSANEAFTQDLGAQYILLNYTRVLSLIRQLGLEHDLVSLSPIISTVHQGRVIHMDSRNPLSAYFQGVLGKTEVPLLTPWNPFLWNPWGMTIVGLEKVARKTLTPEAQDGRRILAAYQKTAPLVRHLPLGDYGAWAQFDDETAEHWVLKNYGQVGTDRLVQPMVEGFFFQQLHEVSKAFLFWMMGNLEHGDRGFVLKNGVQSLAEAAARQIKDVRYNTTVESLSQNPQGDIEVVTNRGIFRSPQVIVAVPPPIANSFFRKGQEILTSTQKEFLTETTYASAIVVNLEFEVTPEDLGILGKTQMLSIPLVERTLEEGVASISIETGKHKSTGNHQVLGIHIPDRTARLWMDKSDLEITAWSVGQVQRFIPSLSRIKFYMRVQRWPYATSSLAVGRARFLARFWEEQMNSALPIKFIGDGTTFPTLEGVVDSAHRVVKSMVWKKKSCSALLQAKDIPQ